MSGGDRADDAVGCFGWLVVCCLCAVFCLWLWSETQRSQREFAERCDVRGGRVVVKDVYKGSVRLCLSKDGRVLE